MGRKKAEEQDFLTRSMRKEKRGTVTPISEELNKHLSENVLRKKARNINREYRTKRMLIKMSVIIICFFLLTYGALAISKKIGGNFEVNLSNGKKQITLSETKDFANPTDMLNASIPETMNNISYTTIPMDMITITDGSYNTDKDNFMAYSFYIKNGGKQELDYTISLNILNFEKGLDEVVRVILIRNDEYHYLAKAKADGTPEKLYNYYINGKADPHALFNEDIDTTPFVSDELGYYELREKFSAGEIDHYTIVVWIEGSDDQCTDDVKSGLVKMNLQFEVLDDDGTDTNNSKETQ